MDYLDLPINKSQQYAKTIEDTEEIAVKDEDVEIGRGGPIRRRLTFCWVALRVVVFGLFFL